MSAVPRPGGSGWGQQQAIRARLARQGGSFVPLNMDEITEQSVPQRFEQQVRQYPDRVAIKLGEQVLTYLALNQAANRVAQAILKQRGDAPEPVALLLGHDASALVAILGILKAGKFFVVLDPSLPPARIKATLEDSQAGLIVTSSQLQALATEVAPVGCKLVDLDHLGPSPASHSNPGNPELARSPDSFAAITYTSGSTGQPKGVIQTHRTLLYRLVTDTNYVCLDAEDRLTLFHFLGSNAALRNLCGALLNGAGLYPFDLRREGVAGLSRWLVQERLTLFHSTPSLFGRWADTLSGEEKFPDLRIIRLGAEATPLQDIDLFKKHFTPGCILFQQMGSTECGPVSTYFTDRETEMPGGRVPVGYQAENVEILLLDEDGREVGFNTPGEMAVRSRYLSPGYWRNPELTQAKFLPDPTGGNRRTYLTGDLGLRHPDGCLFHLGRKDFQVKIRGYRVELAEIELALAGANNVKEAAVVPREDQPGSPRLVAYVVPKQKPAPSVSALRLALEEKLPSYMVPSAFVMLEALPLLPMGKVNRLALPAPDYTRPELGTPFVAPRTPEEVELATIWAQVLGLEQVGVDDDFMELGGDSLLATQVIFRVIRSFKVSLPLHILFGAPTVARMAEVVAQHQASHAKPDDVERLLAELEALSEDQAKHIVASRMVGRQEGQA